MKASGSAFKGLGRNTDGFSPGHFVLLTTLSAQPVLLIELTQAINHFSYI